MQTIGHLDQLASLENHSLMQPASMDLWIRSEEVSVYEIEMPDVPQRKRAGMLPWLLEDQLLREPEDLHFVLGAETADKKALVYVVGKDVMNRWLMMAESKLVRPLHFAPDFLALPIDEGYWTVYVEGSRLLVRTGEYTGFAADATLGWGLLELEAAKSEGIRIAAIVEHKDQIPEDWKDRVQAQERQLSWDFSEMPNVNLLAGDFRPTVANDVKPWIPSLVAGAAALAMLLVYMLVQSYQWQKDIIVIEQGVAEAYQDLFGEQWRGDYRQIRAAADQRLRLLEHQFITIQSTPIAELRAVDSALSSCLGCDIQAIKQESDFLNLTFKPNESVRARLDALADLKLDWGNPDQQGHVVVKASMEAGDG